MRMLTPLVFTLLTLHAAAGEAPRVNSAADAALSGDSQRTLDHVRQFLEKFIDPGKTAAQYADFFAEDAEYYGHGVVGRQAIVRDVERYTRRWPWRSYRLERIDYITPDPATNRIFVSYRIEYEVANANRNITGKADYGAVIADPDGAPRIEWIKERTGGGKRLDTRDTLDD